jgi:metal-dependent amidase/aminoacylase/carboxypeptidase family protein
MHIRNLAVLIMALTLGASAVPVPAADTSPPQTAPTLLERVVAAAAARESSLISVRHDLHRHPDVSGSEVRTARIIAGRLAALGFEVRSGVGGHGVVGVLRGAHDGPLVAFRADMDAVRSQAPDPVAYRSAEPGVRHICGHDVHVAIGLGLAEGFAAVRHELAGAVMLVFQPAEETATGARAMLADGVFGRERPDAIYAVHTSPYEVGTLATRAGGLMAGRSQVHVTLSGSDADANAAAAVVEAIRSIGTVPPGGAYERPPDGFVHVQAFGAPEQGSDLTRIHVQVSTADSDTRARARAAIERKVRSLERPGLAIAVRYQDTVIAGVTNDSTLVARGNQAIRRLLGDDAVVHTEGAPPAFSEDFGSFQSEVPGVMYFLGVSNAAAGTVGMPHTDAYVADDAAILVGVRSMAAVLVDRLGEPSEREARVR